MLAKLKHFLNQKIDNLLNLLLKTGRFFRLVDENFNQISLVNIALLVIIVKVALAVDPSVADLGALLIGLLAHYGKRRINVKMKALDAQQNKEIEETKGKLKDLADRVGSIAAAMGFKNLK
jgi:hypothetical protein